MCKIGEPCDSRNNLVSYDDALATIITTLEGNDIKETKGSLMLVMLLWKVSQAQLGLDIATTLVEIDKLLSKNTEQL
jgi:hypothetical protein